MPIAVFPVAPHFRSFLALDRDTARFLCPFAADYLQANDANDSGERGLREPGSEQCRFGFGSDNISKQRM